MAQVTGPSPSVYQVLPSSTIRLLVLAPGVGNASLKAEFRLRHVGPQAVTDHDVESDLGHQSWDGLEETPYEALSYTWGEPVFSQTIECHGALIPITQNLFDALIHIRNPDTSRTLWADAVCIRQSDDDEKSAQIPLMRQIFSEAQRVLIWLGLEDELTVGALNVIETMIREAKSLAGQLNTTITDLRTPKLQRRLWTQLGLPHDDREAFRVGYIQPIEALLARPWFSRVWTIQEVVLPRVASVLIGPKSFDWTHLGVVITYLGWKNKENIHAAMSWNMSNAAGRVLASRSLHFDSHYRMSLGDLLSMSSGHKFTNARDKIYALLGLAEHDLGIQPDYRSAVRDVYMDAMRRLIFHEKSSPFAVSILNQAERPYTDNNESEDFPSWVPLWHQHPATTTNLGVASGFTAGGRQKQKDSSVFPDAIRLEGFIVDTVKSVTKKSSHTTNWLLNDEIFLENLVQMLQLVASLDTPYPNGEAILDVFAQLLTAGGKFGKSQFRYHFARLFFSATENLGPKATEKVKIWNRVDGLLQKIHDVLRVDSELVSDLDSAFQLSMFNVLNRCEVFKLHNDLLGLGPDSLREGDIICIFYDARQPFALRELDDGSFKLLGECYVHGIMYGEALEEGQQRSQSFTIR